MGRDLLPTLQKQKSWQADKWTARHRKVVALEMSGLKSQEIAQIMGYSEAKVSIILNDDRADIDRRELAGKIADRVQDTHLRLQLLANEALDEIVDEMRSSADENVRQRAAFSILDRGGYSKINKTIVARQPLDEEVVDRLEEAMSEIIELEEGEGYEVLEPEMEEVEWDEDEKLPLGARFE